MIDSYSFGRLSVEGRAYTSDVIIYPERVDASWWRQEGHRLRLADLAEVWAAAPEVIVVGTGATGLMKVDPEVEAEAARRGIRLVVARSKEACQEYNRLAPQGRTVACLHLTC